MGMNIGSRPRSPSVDRTKRRRLAVGAAFTMLEAGKQGSKVAPEPGGAGTRPQPPRAVPAPGHRLGRASPPAESLLVPGARAEPGEPTCVQAAVPPPPRGEARRAGSTLWGGAAQQMHTRSLSDLHMERRHLSPSPTPAPTRHVARELPAPPPAPREHGSQPQLRPRLRLSAGAEQGEPGRSALVPPLGTAGSLSEVTETVTAQGPHCFPVTAQWSPHPPGILPGAAPSQPERREARHPPRG